MKNLRVRTLFLAGIMLVLTMGLLSQPAQARFYIDIPGSDPCVAGVPFTIEIHMNNNTGANVEGITNGFRLYSPNGATWQTPTYDTAGGLGQYLDGGVSLNGFSVDGSGADTIGLGGFRMFQPGVPNGYDDVVLRIETKMSSDGDTLCIDSSWYPPAGYWLWATPSGSVVPSWEGPYCWEVVPQTSIAGYKFDDLNSNSVWDGGEPGLPNWEINLWDGPNLIGQTLTGVNGYYEFFVASAGTYGVSESNQLGWVQTYPLTVFYMINLQQGDNLTDFDFGNCDTLCEDSVRWDTCFAGTMDDFVGPEPCHWSQEMENWITQFNHIANFDEPANNQYFGHTIEGCWDDDCLVLEATLTIRITPSNSGCGNDCIALGEYKTVGGMSFWWTYISELCGDKSWDFGDVETFTLDLANLPVTGHDRTNNILAGLQDGTIDIVVQDDSKVDWIQLEVKLCCPFCYADGDANNNGMGLTTTDLAYLDAFITGPGPAPIPLYSCDLNGDGVVDIADLQLYNDYFIYGIGVFAPYGGYPVKCPCYPTAAPVPDTVHIYGLEHTSLGMACLENVTDTLEATRLGWGQEAGVRIHLPDGCSGWKGYYKNPECSAPVTVGARVVTEYRGTVDDIPDQLIGSVEIQNLDTCPSDTCTRSLYVNSSAITYTVQVYREGTCVYQTEGFSFNGSRNTVKSKLKKCWDDTGSTDRTYTEYTEYDDNGNFVKRWGGYGVSDHPCGIVDIGGGPSGLEYDEILFISEQADTTPATFTSVSIWTDSIPSLSIVSEIHMVDFNGLSVSNLGNAILTPVGTTLVVGNIGPSGLDGAKVEPEDGDYPDDLIYCSLIEIIIENPDQGGDLPIGSEIRGVTEHTYTDANEDRYYVDLAISYTKNASNIWDLAVEAEATLYSVEAYRDDTLVFNVDSIPVDGLGQIVETAKGVHPVGFQGGSTGKEATLSCIWQAPDGVQWTWAAHGVSNLEIDKLSVTAEDDDTTLVGISSASILGSNGAKSDPISFTILDIQVETGCCQNRGDVDGSGAIDVGDLTYLVAYLFQGGPEPSCPEEGDVDASGAIDVGDLTYLVAYLFQGGNPPPDCGATPKISLGKVTRSDVSLSTTCDDDGATTISLESAVDLRGLQIDLRGEGNNRTVKLVDQALELYFHQDGDEARIGILDLEGAALINKGTSALVRLDGEYEIVEAVASDLSHNTFSPSINSAAKTAELPHEFALHQNYPNPFNPSTQINFCLPQASDVKLEVYNVLGQQVVTLLDDFREAGNHTVSWNSTNNSGKQVSSGVYFYRLQAADYTDTRKMLLLK